MPTFDQIRQSYPDAAKASDEEIILRWAQLTGTDVTTAASDFGVQHNPQRNPLGAGLSAGVDQLQGLGYGAVAAGARALGAEGVADWADRGVTRNYAESAFNGRSDLERIEYQSLGSALPFLGYQVAKQVPMLAGTLAASAAVPQAAIPAALSRGLAVIPKGLGGGGLKAGMDFAGRRAALEAGNAFGRTIAASYPIGVGAMYGEAVERGDPTQSDALAALGLGVPYGAAEAVMPSMVRNAFGSNAARFAGGLPTRLAKAGGLGFAGEAGTELFQNELEMGFAGNLTQDEIDSRRLNSAVIGGLVGGTFNLPAGFRGQRNPADPVDILNRDTTPQAPTAPTAGLNLTNLAVPQPGIFNDPSQVEQWAGIATAPTAEQHASRAEDILAAFNTPVGEVGGRPVTAWEAFQREQGVPANRIQTGPAQIKEAAPKIDIPVPQSLQSDPVRSAVAQASPATLRRDGTLKRNVEEAIAEYEGFMPGEIERSIEALSASRKADAVWRVAALEAIARQRAAQGAPNVAQVDAASGQGAGAVPAGSAGNTPSSPVVLDGVRRPAGAPAPSSAARVPVGEPVVQQPASVEGRQKLAGLQAFAQQVGSNVSTEEIAALPPQEVARLYDMIVDARRLNAEVGSEWSQAAQNWIEGAVRSSIASQALGNRVADMKVRAERFTQRSEQARKQGVQPANVPPTQQVAPQATEARGQESAQAGAEQSRDAERAQVSRIFDTLSEREREILTKYHFDKMTFEEIGSELKERGESGTTRQRIEQQHKEALKKLAEAGRPFGLTPERLRLYFPDESRRMAGGADIQTASAAEVAQAGAGMTYRNESNNGAVNQANDEFEMADAVDGTEALDLDTDIAREEFDEGFRGEQGTDVDVLEQVEAVESMARTERDHAGREITEDAIRIAGLEYDQDLQEGDVPFAQLDRADQIRYTKAAIAFNDEVLSAQQLMRVFGEIADGARQQASQPQRAVEEAGAVAQVQGAVPARDAGETRQEAGAREEVTPTPVVRDVGRTAAREYAAGALTRLQQYYDTPNLAALASRLENASNTASLDSELDTDLEWVQDLNLSNDLAKVRRDAAAIERLAATHPEAFELGYLRAQDYGGFASDGPVREMINHMAIASARPSAEFGSPRDYYVQRDAQAPEGVNQIDSRTLGVGDGNRFSRTADTQSNRAFKRWFGDSKVVDAQGNPLVVYHGGAKGITAFDRGLVGRNFGYDALGFFFTTERGDYPGTADRYAGPDGDVYPVYLSIQNPYTLGQFAADLNLEVDDLVFQEGSPQSPITVFDTDRAEIMRRVREGGYDGVAFQVDYGDGTTEGMFVALEPNQIKSATYNNGEFDPSNPDIRRSEGANTQGTTVEAVRSAINAIATPMGRRKVTVYQTADEAVQSGALNSKDAKGTQGWVDSKGNAFFIAGNIPNGSELAVVLHEIGAHLGIEKLLTDAQYEALVKKIFAWAQSDANTQEARIASAALARVDAAKLENEADLAPETIAYFIEEAVKAGVNPTAMQYKTELGRWFRTLWAAFKVALRRLNLINADRLTAQNVVDLAYGAARIELASAYHGTAANFRRFDHRFMGSGEGAQAFGWGTYLAQRFGIANEYFEADVGRKSGVLYKGEAIKQSWPRGQEPTDLETALAAVAARFADSYSLRKALQKGTVTASDFKSAIADAQYELASDGDMAAHDALENVRPEDFGVGQAEGNIHIVDVNFTEDEMLDWFEPISKQSPQVREALETVFDNYDIGIAGYDNLDMTGEQMYKRLSGSRGLGSDKAASEYLDSLGIKGIKFLDAKSRDQTPRVGAVQLRHTPWQNADKPFIVRLLGERGEVVKEGRAATEQEARSTGAAWKADYEKLDQTRNLVVFNDRNIYRVGSMRGGPVDKGGRMMFSKAADPQLTELAQESGQRAWAAIRAGVRKGWTGLAFSSHLANAAHRAGLTSARALELVQRKKATRAYEIQIEVEKVLSKFADLKGQTNGRPTSEVVQRFIYDSTFDKKWGFKPDWKQDAVVDPEMERRFNALPTEAQTVIKDVFRHGDAIFKEKQDLLRKTITGEYEALIKAETDDGKRRKLERQRDKELREAGRLIAEMNGPYAPLRRYGNYVVVAKSQKYRDAEAAGSVDAKLKRDENHYVVEFAETLYEAERLQGVLEGKFSRGMVWAGEKETATEQFGELPFVAVQRLRKMVDTDLEGELNTKSKRVLNKLLVDLYISTLHEANARHSEQKRQFVNRADRDTAAKDMMRAFATQGRADSHLVSALQFNSEIVDEMQKLRNEAKNGHGDSLLKTRLRNEILQRHMMDLDFRETPVPDKLMSLNSFWMLLTSPGYYVQNATQVMMMTQPVLAGKFGQNRSMRQLMRGYQDAVRVLNGSSWNEAADLSRFNGTADEKAMLIELQARGTLDFGISAELGYWESRGEISKVFNQVMRKVGMGTRKLEVLNRMSSALAAYRLMYDQTTGTQAKRHAVALDYADSIIKDTHGDYSSTNAPRYLRMMPKVMTQFRKFQLIQLSLFAKVIHGSIKGANPQEKRAMRAALGYLFMNHALLAGAVGVPASALLGAIYAIAGDDDDPNDWEVDVRRAIGDKEVADLILHGLPSLININMSNKIGAGTMLDPLPFVEYEATRGGYEKAVTAAMGPLIGGLGAQVVDAFGRILKGDVAQGTAQLLPRGFRDAARGFMAAQDGIQLRNGQTALTPEELSFYDSLMMGLGLPTLKTTSRTETQFKSQQYEQFFRERVTKLKRQYSEAYEENDREAMLEARQAWAEMQSSRKNLGFKVQPLSELLKAPREKAKAEAKLENGIRTTEQARGFVQSLQ